MTLTGSIFESDGINVFYFWRKHAPYKSNAGQYVPWKKTDTLFDNGIRYYSFRQWYTVEEG